MKPNWTAIIMTVLTVTVGLACAVLALTLAKGDSTASGLLFGVAGTALGSFLKQPHKAGDDGGDDRVPDKGAGAVGVLFCAALIGLLAELVVPLLVPRMAHAEDATPAATAPAVAPAAAPAAPSNWDLGPRVVAVAGAIDLGSGAFVASTSLAIGPCFGATYRPLAFGADVCGNLQLANKQEPNRYGVSGLLHWKAASAGVGGFVAQGEPWRVLVLFGAGIPFLQF